MELPKVKDVPLWIGVPPVDAEYQLNTGEDCPDVDVTLADGIPGPHWEELVAVGVEGATVVVTVTVAVIEQPATDVAVTV